MVMAGLDLTHQLLATPARDRRRARPPGPPGGGRSPTCSTFYSAGYVERDPTLAGAAVHDPCAVLALTHPELFEREPGTSPSRPPARLTRGMTVIDRRTMPTDPPANCDVLTRIDGDAAWDVIVDAVG